MFKQPTDKTKFVDGGILLIKLEDIVSKQRLEIKTLTKKCSQVKDLQQLIEK